MPTAARLKAIATAIVEKKIVASSDDMTHI
jgi:hypothetical protein